MTKSLQQALKSAETLAKPNSWKSAGEAKKHIDQLRAFDPSTLRVENPIEPAVAEARRAFEERLDKSRSTFWPALRSACETRGLRVERVTQEPFEVRIGHLTAVIDLLREKIAIRYARETVEERDDLDVDELLDACSEVEKTLRERAGATEERFEKVARSYRMARAEKRLPAEEYVDLVDLLPLYALCSIPEAKRSSARIDVAANKAQLAFDLALLRQEGALTHGDVRLVLGSATGRSASNKKNVLYVENATGEGQYYLGLALRRVAGGDA